MKNQKSIPKCYICDYRRFRPLNEKVTSYECDKDEVIHSLFEAMVEISSLDEAAKEVALETANEWAQDDKMNYKVYSSDNYSYSIIRELDQITIGKVIVMVQGSLR